MASALSITYEGISRDIKTPAKIKNIQNGKEIETIGIWDTGATGSVITKDMAMALGLIPVSLAQVMGVTGSKMVNVYYVKILLSNGNVEVNAQVTECDQLSSDQTVGMLIGMDIITHGDFCISNFQGKTTMTFICPSQQKVDYVEEMDEHNKYYNIYKTRAAHGNELCPCGSGKKYKNCHGKKTYL